MHYKCIWATRMGTDASEGLKPWQAIQICKPAFYRMIQIWWLLVHLLWSWFKDCHAVKRHRSLADSYENSYLGAHATWLWCRFKCSKVLSI